jgi:hypothetical protein
LPGDERFYISQLLPDLLWGFSSLLPNQNHGLFAKVKQQWLEAIFPLASSFEVRNAMNCTCSQSDVLKLRGIKQSQNFFFLLVIVDINHRRNVDSRFE